MSYSARVLRKRSFCLEVTVAALVLLTPAAYGVHEAQDLMYWTDSSSMNTDGELGGVRRASIEGGALVAEGQVEVWGVAIDTVHGKAYWTEAGTETIHRADLDGDNPDNLVTGEYDLRGIAVDAAGGHMYWTNSYRGDIKRADLDGSNKVTLLSGLDDVHGIALDAGAGMMYWSDTGAGTVARMDMEGIALLVAGRGDIVDVAVDAAEGKMYWTENVVNTIFRAKLDGSGIETLISGASNPAGVALDLVNDKMYWSSLSGFIARSNLDGTDGKTIVPSLETPWHIALDVAGGKMYWTDMDANCIQRADLDGSSVENLLSDLKGPFGIALDLVNGQMYWSEYFDAALYRADLDGTDVQTLTNTTTSTPLGVAVDPAAGKMYWSEDSGIICRANLDGSGVEELYSGYALPYSLTFEPNSRMLYWPERDGEIHRAGADGIRTLVSGAGAVAGIALDLADGKVYWAEKDAGAIRRAGLDGSNAENVLTGLSQPFAVAVDSAAGKLYWSQWGDETVHEANLDGSGDHVLLEDVGLTSCLSIEPDIRMLYWSEMDSGLVQRIGLDILTPLVGNQDTAAGIALDLNKGKMYWAEGYTGIIHRADLNGSNVEDLVTGLTVPVGVALDLVHDRIYWTEHDGGYIRRANLNGTGIENLRIGDANGPSNIALDLVHHKMYWVDDVTGDILRADLDGMSPELLVEGQALDFGFALDLIGDKMYYTGSGGILRANLDGSVIELAVTYSGTPRGIAIDKASEKLYWTTGGAVQRSGMTSDGSDIEVVWGALNGALGIALDVDTPPIIYEIDQTTAYNGHAYHVTPALIQGSGPLTWTLTRPVSPPGGMSINPATGEVSWTANILASPVNMTIQAAGPGGADTESWTINVEDTGDVPPVIDEIPDAALREGAAYSMTPTLLEGSPPFTWSLTSPSPLPGDMAVSSSTGTVTWTPDTVASPVPMTLQVVGAAGTDTESWTITVAHPSANEVISWPPSGFIEEGCVLTLCAPSGSGYYRWKKDGALLSDDPPRITGTTSQMLIIDGVSKDEDEGVYSCVYDDGLGKALVETEPYHLVVLPAGTLPATGGLGLCAMAGFLALGGAGATWRRRRLR